jgi:hypothetical protein
VAKGIIGEEFTFQVLFLDQAEVPTDVNDPEIEVFYYDETGIKITVVAAGTTLPKSLPNETGRYAYTMTIDSSYDERVVLFGRMTGVDPASGLNIEVEEHVDLFTTDGGTTSCGLIASFVKPGVC